MKTVQTETDHAPKQRRYRFWSRFVLLLGLPLLLYYGYCWGLWGRGSLLLQYLFQCGCPAVSEEARYPEQVDVIVPACKYVSTSLSPSGRLLSVYEEKFGHTSTYLLDLQNDKKIPLTLPENSGFYFLTNDLLYVSVSYGGGEYISDRTTDMMFPIQKFRYSRPDAQINSDTNLTLLAEALRESMDVFFIDNSSETVMALASDFRTSPEHNFVMDRFDIPSNGDLDRVKIFLQENNIAYQIIPAGFPDEAISQYGRFIARSDGIYLVETNQKIVEGYSLSVRGWTYDGTGVIYSHALGRCLIRISLPLADDTSCLGRVPQPVLKLKVPQEYLPPKP